MQALRLRPEDTGRVSFACCYTYAGILPHEVLADAGGTAAEISEFWHLVKSAPSVPYQQHVATQGLYQEAL